MHQPDETMPPSDHGATAPMGGGADRTVPPESGGAEPPRPATTRGEAMPERIGGCRVEKRLGSGGFGDVWLAVQETDLLKRRVAIKLLKRGMDSESVLERFRMEQKVLDTLNHPNIARLFGGGVTEDGRSYFIMEFVEGLTLDAWCQRQGLETHERLKLLKQVAAAMAHAHDKGIVHRDLKPANVLVGADGVPKLLDFGIAKFVSSELSDSQRSHQTLPGEIGPLTPVYASPEQLRGEPLNASTDIYSMGVMMYEILTGQLPFDFSGCGFDQVKRRVCEEMPPKPSDAATLGVTTANGRKTTAMPAKTRRVLRGDLDNIVLMAMRKEAVRRYASMQAIIADIDALLEDRPVSARPNSVVYRTSKWIGRNRLKVLLPLLLSLAAGVAWYLTANTVRRTVQRQAIAEAKQKVESKGAREEDRARDAAGTIEALQDLEKKVRTRLKTSSSDLNAQRELRELLRKRAAMAERARDTATGLEISAELVPLARAINDRAKDAEDRRGLAAALQQHADLLVAANRFEEARKPMDESMDMRRKARAENPSDLTALQLLGKAIVRMHELEVQQANYTAAVKLSEELRAVRKEVLDKCGQGATDKDRERRSKFEREAMLSHLFLAMDLMDLNDLDRCEGPIDDYLALARKRLAEVPQGDVGDRVRWERQYELSLGIDTLAKCRVAQDRLPAAIEASREALKMARASVSGSEGESQSLRQYVYSGIEQARYLNESGDHAGALQLVQDTVEFAEERRSSSQAKVKGEAMLPDQRLRARAEQLRALRRLGREAEAAPILDEVTATAATPQDGVEWNEAMARVMREVALLRKDPQDGLRPARQSVEAARVIRSPVEEACSLAVLSESQRRAGNAAEADRALAEAVQVATKAGIPLGGRLAREFTASPATPWSSRPAPKPAAAAPAAPSAGPPTVPNGTSTPPPQAPVPPSPPSGVGTTGAQPPKG